MLARGFLDPAAPVQGAVHSADGDVGQFGDQVDAALLLVHARRACFFDVESHKIHPRRATAE
jgi:hypothetical protein